VALDYSHLEWIFRSLSRVPENLRKGYNARAMNGKLFSWHIALTQRTSQLLLVFKRYDANMPEAKKF
jgi:hypothetical protein